MIYILLDMLTLIAFREVHTSSVINDTIADLGVENIVGGHIPNRVARISIICEPYNGQDARPVTALTSTPTVVCIGTAPAL